MDTRKKWIIGKVLGLALAACVLGSGSVSGSGQTQPGADASSMASIIRWLGHDSFRIDGEGIVIYIDPYQIKPGPKADLILITHDHRDHASPEDVAKIQDDKTIIVTVASAAAKLSGQIQTVKPGDKIIVKGIPIEAVPAYNVNKFRSPGVPFHPRESGFVGFILTVKGIRIYHAGDTDVIPEMKDFKCDVALLPVSGTYVMTADEALEAAKIIQPKLAIPMHIGRGIGSQADLDHFKAKSTVPSIIMTME